jgi:hypothetical protein
MQLQRHGFAACESNIFFSYPILLHACFCTKCTTIKYSADSTDSSVVPPALKGGQDAWLKFLVRNVHSSVLEDNNAPAGKYTVVVSFW